MSEDMSVVPNRVDRRKKKFRPSAKSTASPWLARADQAHLRPGRVKDLTPTPAPEPKDSP